VSNETGPRRPGRKRSEESRRAILMAALELFFEVGYARLTIEGIAARSGTGKQTIYRWWTSKADILLEAITTKAELVVPDPDEGAYVADLRMFLSASFGLARHLPVAQGLRALMAEAQIDPGFGERFRSAFVRHRRDALQRIVDRARARGDLPGHLSPDTVADIVFGVIWYRVLATSRPMDDRLVDELVLALTGPRTGPSPRSEPPSPASEAPPSSEPTAGRPQAEEEAREARGTT
jgi:AcrR family transcriptional regulator